MKKYAFLYLMPNFWAWVETLSKMSHEERVAVVQSITPFLTAFVGACGVAVYFYKLYASAQAKLDAKKDTTGVILTVSQVLLLPTGGMTIEESIAVKRCELAIQTPPELPDLASIIRSVEIEAEIARRTRKCTEGHRLLMAGKSHYVAMQRLCTHISGPSAEATADVMHGRHEGVNTDIDAVYLTCLRGEDGIRMPHALWANPDHLGLFLDDAFVDNLTYERFVHADYVSAIQEMAREHKDSHTLFRRVRDGGTDREQGRQAAVWHVVLRTRRRVDDLSAEMVQQMIDRAVQRAVEVAQTSGVPS